MQNKTSKEFTRERKRAGLINALKSGKLYEEYLNHPNAQYKMTFSEYKKKRKKILFDGGDLVSTEQRIEKWTIRQCESR